MNATEREVARRARFVIAPISDPCTVEVEVPVEVRAATAVYKHLRDDEGLTTDEIVVVLEWRRLLASTLD